VSYGELDLSILIVTLPALLPALLKLIKSESTWPIGVNPRSRNLLNCISGPG